MKQGKTVLLIVIVIAVLGVLVYLGLNQAPVENPDADMNTATENADSTNAEEQVTPNDLPPAVFNTAGEIIDIGSDSITIQTDGSHMQSGENVTVTVSISDSTNVLDAANNEISLSDLSEGDQVSIESGGNIKDQTEFSASNVKLSE